jgi:hypothetical protein
MTDATTLSGFAVSASGRRPTVYAEAREVTFRARVARNGDSPALQNALERLDRTLASGQPLAREVPRGYYVNILV